MDKCRHLYKMVICAMNKVEKIYKIVDKIQQVSINRGLENTLKSSLLLLELEKHAATLFGKDGFYILLICGV